MKVTFSTIFGSLLLLVGSCFLVPRAGAQSIAPSPGGLPDVLFCSPAPCVLPPIQASEGGLEVADSPIAANPLNPQHLIVGSTDFNCTQIESVAFHLSTDGGSSWSRYCMASLLTKQGECSPGGQPMLGYDHNGVAYIAAGYGCDNGKGFIGFQKSNAGVTWSTPAVVTSAHIFDTWLAVDANPQSPWINSLYLSGVIITSQYEVVVVRSNDGGATWTQVAVAPVQVPPAEDDYTNVTVGSDGTVYLTWLFCVGFGPAAGCKNGTAYLLFSKSLDGGNTWSYPTQMTTVELNNSVCHCSISSLPNTNHIPVDDYPAIGVDNSSGPYAGNLYVVMHSWTGSYLRVQVVRSSDGGTTWSKPVPVAPPSDTHDQFFPWLSVSSTGLVGVSWLDRRNDPANIDYQAFAAISADGGQTFKPNVQLTTAFSNPNNNGGPNNSWMGDYAGNTWAGPNFVAAWMDSSNGVDMQDMVGGIRLHR